VTYCNHFRSRFEMSYDSVVVIIMVVSLFVLQSGLARTMGPSNYAPIDSHHDTIDEARLGKSSTVLPPAGPEGVLYDNASGDVYVADHGNISVIDTATNAVTASIELSNLSPEGMALDDITGNLYVAEWGANSVAVISTSTNKVVDTVRVGGYPESVAYDPDNGDLYTTNCNTNNVSVIYGSSNVVVETIPVGVCPMAIAYDNGNDAIYVANELSWNVSVISGATNEVVDTIQIAYWSGHTFILSSNAMAYDPANGFVYLVNTEFNNVSVINGTSNSIISSMLMSLPPEGIVCDGENNRVYVSVDFHDYNAVMVFNAKNWLSIAEVPVGLIPEGMAYDRVTGDIYVVNAGTDNVSVISGNTVTVVATVSLVSSSLEAAGFLGLPGSQGYYVLGIGAAAGGIVVAVWVRALLPQPKKNHPPGT